jgi:hypothetical protein
MKTESTPLREVFVAQLLLLSQADVSLLVLIISTSKLPLNKRAVGLAVLLPKSLPKTMKKKPPVVGSVTALGMVTEMGIEKEKKPVRLPDKLWTDIRAGKFNAAELRPAAARAMTVVSLIQRVEESAVAPSRALWLALAPYTLPKTVTAVCPVCGALFGPKPLTTTDTKAGKESPPLISNGVPFST